MCGKVMKKKRLEIWFEDILCRALNIILETLYII